MKEYIKPSITSQAIQPEELIASTLPIDRTTEVPGPKALSKSGDIWDMEYDEEDF